MQTVHRVTQDMAEAYARLELLFQALAHQVFGDTVRLRTLRVLTQYPILFLFEP